MSDSSINWILGFRRRKLGSRSAHSLAVDEFHRTAARGILRGKREKTGRMRIARLFAATRVRKDMAVVEVEKW